RDHTRIHVSCRSQPVRLRIHINRNPPAMRRQFVPGPLRTKQKASAKTPHLLLQPPQLNFREHILENSHHFFVASEPRNRLRVIPAQLQREGNLRLAHELSLPMRIEFPVLADVFIDLPKLRHDFPYPPRYVNPNRGGRNLNRTLHVASPLKNKRGRCFHLPHSYRSLTAPPDGAMPYSGQLRPTLPIRPLQDHRRLVGRACCKPALLTSRRPQQRRTQRIGHHARCHSKLFLHLAAQSMDVAAYLLVDLRELSLHYPKRRVVGAPQLFHLAMKSFPHSRIGIIFVTFPALQHGPANPVHARPVRLKISPEGPIQKTLRILS